MRLRDNNMSTSFFLNGVLVEATSNKTTPLLKVIRDEFFLTGTKSGCETGECGACLVLLDDIAVNSCLVLLGEIEGKTITTIEGLNKDGILDQVQVAFAELGALQCGFCTPGMIIAAKALLMHNPHPTRDEILIGLSGNLCRCTGYEQIVEAVESILPYRTK